MTLEARTASAAKARATTGYPQFPAALPTLDVRAGRYRLRFACTRADLDAALRLRFAVFNLELGEGLDTSYATGRDEDGLDDLFHHLLITRADTDEVVGTYRMQTSEMAAAGRGFYSAGEFEIDRLPPDVTTASVEIGRACVAREHRNGRVLHLLWRGLAAYLGWNGKRYLFGCCSLPTLDEAIGRAVNAYLRANGFSQPGIDVAPVAAVRCGLDGPLAEDVSIPPLFESYLRLGAKICGPPAVDRLFKTIDFLVMLDCERLDPRTYRTFFAGSRDA